MKVTASYRKNEFNDEDFSYLRSEYEVNLRPYEIKHSALDLVTIIEFTFASIAGGILYDYIKGATGFKEPERLGEMTREYLSEFKDAISKIYSHHCSDNLEETKAYAYVDYFELISIYAVLNHTRSNRELILKLPEALLKVYSLIPDLRNRISDEILVIQIYPDFQNNDWRYLFLPTINGMLNHIDRIFDMIDGVIVDIDSNEEFMEKFKPEITDKFKFVVSFERDNLGVNYEDT